MLQGGVRVEGLSRLVRDLQEMGVALEDIKEAFARIASVGASTASSFAPVKSGKLAGTIRGNKAKNKAVITAGRARVPYAGAINYGWPSRGIRASGFMQKADERLKPLAPQMLEDEIRRLISERGLS